MTILTSNPLPQLPSLKRFRWNLLDALTFRWIGLVRGILEKRAPLNLDQPKQQAASGNQPLKLPGSYQAIVT
jgi:hypothetical protein